MKGHIHQNLLDFLNRLLPSEVTSIVFPRPLTRLKTNQIMYKSLQANHVSCKTKLDGTKNTEQYSIPTGLVPLLPNS